MGRANIESVTAYVSPDTKNLLAQWAKEEKRSVSFLIAQLIEDAVKNRQQEATP